MGRIDKEVVRAAQDVVPGVKVVVTVNVAGAQKAVLEFKATSPDALAGPITTEHSFDGDAFQRSDPAFVVETGDAIAGQALNNGTGICGRTRVYTAADGVSMPHNWLRISCPGNATATVKGLEVVAFVHRPDARNPGNFV